MSFVTRRIRNRDGAKALSRALSNPGRRLKLSPGQAEYIRSRWHKDSPPVDWEVAARYVLEHHMEASALLLLEQAMSEIERLRAIEARARDILENELGFDGWARNETVCLVLRAVLGPSQNESSTE